MRAPLEIRLLGPFEVVAGGTLAEVGGSKRQALLAMLALRQGRVVDVDALVEGLWGEVLPAAPRNALHHHIARLRAALGESSIVGSADGYALSDARVDAVRFEESLAETRGALRDGDVRAASDAVAAALALWRGPALQGLTGTAWFSAEARRLETLHVDALEERFEVALALGEHRELTAALRSALADNPFRERLWGQLMLALYRSQADALEAFQEARRVLGDELGLEPGLELRRLQEAILAHDPAIAAVPVDRRRRGNLPALSTSFVGREDELGQVAGVLREHRLVTLTGPPGVGKSRLGLEAAGSLEHEFGDGIWLVDFARAGEAADAVRLLADAVDVRGSASLARVTSRLSDAGALIVLDACEHVLDEAARIASMLVAQCPRVRILATSREALRVVSEVRVPIAPLPLPDDGTAAARSAAVALFLERARAARPGFEPDAEDLALAEEVARRVDGLPLAIELAAARVNVLGLAELVSILERRAAFLRDTPATDPSRIALQGLVEWSYDLLHGDEKTLLQQLAVHRGGASLASLVAVAEKHGLSEATVAYLVAALVDKSVVSASFSGGVARYDMLDTVREYVLDRLAESGGLTAARAAHADYFATLAEDARVQLRGREWLRWESRLALENDNLWAALTYARDAPDPGLAIRLGTLAWYFGLAGRVSEGRRFLDLALAATRDDARVELRIELLAGLCYLATEELDLDAALTAGERALALAATAAAPRQLGLAQFTLALALAQSGTAQRADAMAAGASATFEAAGDDWGVAASSIIRAAAAARDRDVSTVAAMAAAIRRHSDAIGYDAFRVPGLLLEAWVAERRQDGAAAIEGYRRALELAGHVGFGEHAAFALAGLGSIALANGDLREAEELQRQALATAEAAQAPLAAAHAGIQLARIAARRGAAHIAERQYRQVLEQSQTPRPRQAREVLFVALADSPATAALLGLAELADARGDTAAADGPAAVPALRARGQDRRARPAVGGGRAMRRLTLTDPELAVVAEALREATAADLLTPASRARAGELLDRIDAKLPSAIDHHPAGPATGGVLAGDEILRLLLGHEDRHGHAALGNEAIAEALSWKPAGTSVRELLADLRRGGWLTSRGSGCERVFALTRKGRGRARALQHAGGAPDDEARVGEPDELLDLIYADSSPSTFSFTGAPAEPIPGVWHRPTVRAAARLDPIGFGELEAALRDAGLVGDRIHSYATLTLSGERHARERWHATRPAGAFGGPPRLARPYRRARSVVACPQDRACPNCSARASWLTRRNTRRWEQLRGRGEADFTCPRCDVRWTIYLEPTGRDGTFDPLADAAVCRPQWRYRGGFLHGEALAPPDHHPLWAA